MRQTAHFLLEAAVYTSQSKTPRSSKGGGTMSGETSNRSHTPQVPKDGGSRGRRRTIAAPSVRSKRQGPISMRWQSTWPSKDIFHEYSARLRKKVNDMTGGDLKIEVLASGAVVPAFGLLDAVAKGTLDGGHGVARLPLRQATALARGARPPMR